MTTLSPSQIEAIQQRAHLDSRTVLLILTRKSVGPGVRARFLAAASDLKIKLSRDFFATDDARRPAKAE